MNRLKKKSKALVPRASIPKPEKTATLMKAAAVKASDDRRQAGRRQILENFSIFLVIPSKGSHRLQVTDLSETGIGFYLDIENESPEAFPIQTADKVALKLYVNTTLHIPLSVKVIWVETKKSGRFVGAEFLDKRSAQFRALMPFLQLLDSIAEADGATSERP